MWKGVSMSRCTWVNLNNPLYIAYHDEEWGKPLHDEQSLFELICLESYQAGLSWEIVLNKRQAFRSAFFNYNIQRLQQWLMKIWMHFWIIHISSVTRQSCTLPAPMPRLFFEYRRNSVRSIRIFGNGWTVQQFDNPVKSFRELLTKNDLSERISKDLKKRGFKFVGLSVFTPICRSAGLINDHEETCEIGKKLRIN